MYLKSRGANLSLITTDKSESTDKMDLYHYEASDPYTSSHLYVGFEYGYPYVYCIFQVSGEAVQSAYLDAAAIGGAIGDVSLAGLSGTCYYGIQPQGRITFTAYTGSGVAVRNYISATTSGINMSSVELTVEVKKNIHLDAASSAAIEGAGVAVVATANDVSLQFTSSCLIEGNAKFNKQNYNVSGRPVVAIFGDPATTKSGYFLKYSCAGTNSGQFYLGTATT